MRLSGTPTVSPATSATRQSRRTSAEIAAEFARPGDPDDEFALSDGARVGVIGGGPAGSLFAYFLIETAQRVGVNLSVDVFEARDFNRPGPAGCNMCGGMVSESMIQTLATEGIRFPDSVVQRGLDSFVIHTPERTAYMDIPLHERRIAAMHRGSGPKSARVHDWESFDGFLLNAAATRGAHVVHGRVSDMTLEDGRPRLVVGDQTHGPYELVASAAGVNSATWRIFEDLPDHLEPPRTAKTYVAEFYVGKDWIDEAFGSSMHVFLLGMDHLEFAGLLPKGHYLTLVMVGDRVDDDLIDAFLDHPAVRSCLPEGLSTAERHCQCRPKMNTRGMPRPYADRLLFLGDAGITRYYKDGIGAAYRVAKAAAVNAVFDGVSAQAFSGHYMRTCSGIERDNGYGKLVFLVAGLMQAIGPARRGMMRMLTAEQARETSKRRMTGVLWDTFTGSAPYRDVFARCLHPGFLGTLVASTVLSVSPQSGRMPGKEQT
jgi:flavin-dependent dehydrogenase